MIIKLKVYTVSVMKSIVNNEKIMVRFAAIVIQFKIINLLNQALMELSIYLCSAGIFSWGEYFYVCFCET